MDDRLLAELGEERDHADLDSLREFCVACLTCKGYPEAQAEATAFALVEADARGIFSHGAAGGTGLEEALRLVGVTSTVNPGAEPRRLEQRYPSLGVIDGEAGPGHFTAQLAVEWVKELARAHGIAKVYVHNTNHFGAAGIWAEEIAREGDLQSHVTCTTHSCVRFLGDDPEGVDFTRGAAVGAEHRLGTNPDAWCIPYSGGWLTLDLANTELASSLAFKTVKEAVAAGESRLLKIPDYVADADYRPTLDPSEAIRIHEGAPRLVGSIFPYGGRRGYKGQITLQRIEADQAYGGGAVKSIPLGADDPELMVSQTFTAQAIDFLYPKQEALDRIEALRRDWLRHAGPATRMPGERGYAARAYSIERGIPYSAGQITTLERCGELAGVEFASVPRRRRRYPQRLFTK